MIRKETTGKMVPEVRDVTHCDVCNEKLGYGFEPGITIEQHVSHWDADDTNNKFSICSIKCLVNFMLQKKLESVPGFHPENRDLTIRHISHSELLKILKYHINNEDEDE